MANIRALMYGKNLQNWDSNNVFISNIDSEDTGIEALIHPVVAKAMCISKYDFIWLSIQGKKFKFCTRIENDLKFDFLIFKNSVDIEYIDISSNTLKLVHGHNVPSILSVKDAILSPLLFVNQRIEKHFEVVTLYFDGSCQPNPGTGGQLLFFF